MKDLKQYLKESDLEHFNRLANYNYGRPHEVQELLSLVLDEDDVINTALLDYDRILLEWDNYHPFPPTKCVYRLDKPNNAQGQQKHIHVYSDKSHQHQLYAINIDGTPHDGSHYQLSTKHQDALRTLGFPVPKDGLLEWLDWEGCRVITD